MTKTVKKIDAIDRSLYVLKFKYSKKKNNETVETHLRFLYFFTNRKRKIQRNPPQSASPRF